MTRSLCLFSFLTVVGACCLPEEETIPPPPRPDGGAALQAEEKAAKFAELGKGFLEHAGTLCTKKGTEQGDVELKQAGLFNYCASDWARECINPSYPDPQGGWNYDRPGYREVQLWNGSKCLIMDCHLYRPEIGFAAGGKGDLRDQGIAGGIRVRTGSNTAALFYPQLCWQGDYTWIWPGFESPLTEPALSGMRSFSCFPQ